MICRGMGAHLVRHGWIEAAGASEATEIERSGRSRQRRRTEVRWKVVVKRSSYL